MAGNRLKKSDGATTCQESLKNMAKGTAPLPSSSPEPSIHTGQNEQSRWNSDKPSFENIDFAFEFSPEPVLFLETSGLIVSANPSAIKLLRLQPLAMQDYFFTDFLEETHHSDVIQSWTETFGVGVQLKDRAPHKQRIELHISEDEVVPAEMTLVQNLSGRICVFIRDLSEYEGRLNLKNEALTKLKSRDHLKSRFMAAMSHEIRTPFNAVSGLLDLLAETELDEAQRSLVTTGQEATTALLQITDDLLDYTKIATGNFLLAQHPYHAREVFNTVFRLFAPVAHNKGLNLLLDVDDVDDVYLSGDLPRIQQVLNNFVSNAIKFTESGSVVLWAGTRLLANGKIELTCVVKDTGIGISMDKQARLFGEFYRVEDGDLQTHKGTGLGLAISKTLVRMMDGLIGVNSGMGRGANFWISIPFERVEAADVISQNTPEKASKCVLQKGMNEMERDESIYGVQVLLADDYKTNQMIISRQLEELGANVTVVNNGQEALQVLEATKFDVALMDISMPVMGGVEATEHIRALESDVSQLPVLALTAIVSEEDRAKYLAAGISDVMTKPISQSMLQSKIFSALETKRAQGVNNQAPMPVVSLFDKTVLDSILTGLEPTDVKAITEQFMTDLSFCVDDLEHAVAQSDLDAVQRSSHTLKGLSATFGCIKLSQLAELTNYNAISGSDREAVENGNRSVQMGRDAVKQAKDSFSPYLVKT